MSDAPIGIFDSGVGGLTVARAILDQLPNESTLYVGDTARGPYGPRPLAEVRTFALETLDYLVDQGVKALVIACNTASAAMLRDARERYSVPVIAMSRINISEENKKVFAILSVPYLHSCCFIRESVKGNAFKSDICSC